MHDHGVALAKGGQFLRDTECRACFSSLIRMSSAYVSAREKTRDAKALCIFTTLLGNKATTQRLVQALNRMEGVDPTYVFIGLEDYAAYPVPPWARATNAWEIRHVARQKVQSVLREGFDFLLVNAWEFVTEFKDLARKMPAAALMDAVPATVNAQLLRRGQRGWRRWTSHALQHGAFKTAVRDFKLLLSMGSDCADALASEYGVNRQSCYVTLAPQDLEVWKPSPKENTAKLRLLFVANDFARKGGEFLLRLYEQHLAEFCNLTIASNDASLDRRSFPAGVQWLRGLNHEQLLKIYHANDLFLFPTQQDYMPQVLAEALATGLPCIANDVGGIRDLIHDGETGFLMSCSDPVESWAARIRSLNCHPEERIRLAGQARSFAESKLSLASFEKLLTEVVHRLDPKHNR